MFRKVSLLTLIMLLYAISPVFAEPETPFFGDFVGLSVGDVISAYGPPDGLAPAGDAGPELKFSYTDRAMLGRHYQVVYSLMGVQVSGVEYTALEASDNVKHIEAAACLEFNRNLMGQSFGDIVLKFGAPYTHNKARLLSENIFDEATFCGVSIHDRNFDLICVFEDGKVIDVLYILREHMDMPAFEALVEKLDTGIMADVTADAAWVYFDNLPEVRAAETGRERWFYVREIADGATSTSFIVTARPVSGDINLLLGFGDRRAPGPIACHNNKTFDGAFSQHWHDENGRYTNSGNWEKFKPVDCQGLD